MITVNITSDRQIAGVEAAAAAASTEDAPVTAQEYLQRIVEGACESYRDTFAVDRITSSDFIFRFTAAEFAGLNASSDPIVQGFIAQVKSEPFIWLGSDEAQQGMGYVVMQGLLTQARADAILAYPATPPAVEPDATETP
jgi:hypothetical protein